MMVWRVLHHNTCISMETMSVACSQSSLCRFAQNHQAHEVGALCIEYVRTLVIANSLDHDTTPVATNSANVC